MNSPRIYIILVNYNGAEDTVECVKSLENVTYDNFKIIVVDNKSTDNSAEILREKLEEKCTLIFSQVNRGFAPGNNIGIRKALEEGADYVLLLNNDTLVEPDFLGKMADTFNIAGNAGIVGCQINYYPEKDKVWFGGGRINWRRFSGSHEHHKEKEGYPDSIREIDFMTGCCMLIGKEVFKDAGLLPEEYFMYLEDLDFCVTAKEKGYKIMYNPNAKIYHKVSAATGGEESPFSVQWGNRNRLIFMNRYSYRNSKLKLAEAKLFFYVSRAVKYVRYKLDGEGNKAESMIKGIKDGRKYIKLKSL